MKAKNLLQSFWNLQRKLNENITSTMYATLIKLAYFITKSLNLESVGEIAALLAIYLMEEYTSYALNFSVLDFSSQHSRNLFTFGDSIVCKKKQIIPSLYI